MINGTISNGKKLEAQFMPIEGFSIGQVKVIMDGKDVTAEYYNSNTHMASSQPYQAMLPSRQVEPSRQAIMELVSQEYE